MTDRPRRAPALVAGDRVAVVSPSSPLVDLDRFRAGLAHLEGWGYEPVLMSHVTDQDGHLAGHDFDRAADLNAAIRDPTVRAIWTARGGYGVGRLVDLLDWQRLRIDPKLVVGFSDATALLLAAWERTGLVTLHGPSVSGLAGLGGTAADQQLRALLERDVDGTDIDWGGAEVTTLAGGTGEGPLLGGNLALLCSLIGTVDEPDTRGALVVLEEVGEAPYRIDRMLIQLLRAGLLDEIVGIVVGRPVRCEPVPDRPSATADEVVADVLGDLGIPVVTGAPVGHEARGQIALPLGVRARLDADLGRLTLLGPVTVPR